MKNRKSTGGGKRVAKAGRKSKQVSGAWRRRGRPLGVGSALLERKTIIAVSLQLTKNVPLADLSIVRVARELGVTPALIHYYITGGRDALTSGVMNAFYRELVAEWPKTSRISWREDMETVAGAVYRAHIRYAGIAAYIVSHNKFRMVQDVEDGDTDYGLLFFERFAATVQAIGFSATDTGIYAHLLMEYISANAHATVRHLWPGEHRDFLDRKISQLNPKHFPAAHFVRQGLIGLNASEAFTTGMRLILNSLEMQLKKPASLA